MELSVLHLGYASCHWILVETLWTDTWIWPCPNADYTFCSNIWLARNIPLFPCMHVWSDFRFSYLFMIFKLRIYSIEDCFRVGYAWDSNGCNETNCFALLSNVWCTCFLDVLIFHLLLLWMLRWFLQCSVDVKMFLLFKQT